MKIGFIGLGIMGKPMAKNIIKGGHELVVLDSKESAIAELVALGARAGTSPKQVAEQVDLVFTMLPNSPQVRDVALGDGGILEGAHPGLVFVDMSSIDPAVSQEVSATFHAHGVAMLDAPVSGGEPMAVSGSLSFMVGGPDETFDFVAPVLELMGSSVVHVGRIGAGNTVKLVNQAIVAANIAVLAEGLVFAQKSGVDPESVINAIRGGLAGSNVMNAKAPMMLQRNFIPGFRVELHLKDLSNVMTAAHAVASPMPMTACAYELMSQLRARGYEKEDHSALLRTAEAAAATVLMDPPASQH